MDVFGICSLVQGLTLTFGRSPITILGMNQDSVSDILIKGGEIYFSAWYLLQYY